ncbi:MAG: aminomethyl-transferring glycine dehydrogenase subunit GcvPA [Candidatus Omnitrophica bacterium]|nr:aminomethyl-transferring glycine dehydrogenase subunit GcvPA [Candidatus Omnitrophota bacterium]MBU1127478.1 aminomethyl-transferring glycine dehydrogenase subunit GcvPA [Candidatus Omnitrophota bacterium]MBU1785048.1 aminomethyl-transferring glycine dehydrogenase subunit GcvPA [Candidatus Omnitrophota bacterium]MBU1851886.1 aminomethyl-transferring glycine dehydrogenase subunit GcvPA [Candidatus Omnitrophota bacterium]
MSYIPNSIEDRQEMLKAAGVNSGKMADLFKNIPRRLQPRSFDLAPGRSEFEVEKYLRGLGKKNVTDLVYFIGGGFYDHYIPAAIDALTSRSEFYTAYTPYQPEASQGNLQAIYEYQSCICRLTGMEAANASLYDGGTALYEAAMMAIRITGRNKIIIDGGVSPIYRKMLYCYTSNLSIDFIEIPVSHGQSDRVELDKRLDEETAAVILQNPNFFGAIDDHADICARCHNSGALVIESVYPIALGLLKTPEAMGADIVTGEGQSLGIPLSFGGPYLGFMATKKKYVRKMPGRIVGATTDKNGNRGFVLTLQTREQHIRREKATSNICSNQALCALRALIYMALVGKDGLKEVASACRDKAEYTKQKLGEIKGVEVKKSSPTFNEFTVKLPENANEVIGKLIGKGIAAGFPLGRYYADMENYMLVAVTEKRTRHEIVRFADALEAALWS